jgi:threonylcarbamoyladenosine tRNA methylthiotransferase MtaB
LAEAQKAIDSGAKEIVLTGVNIGDYGTHHQTSLLELVQRLDELSGVERFRISSIEPNLLSDEIIAFVASSKKFMPHFHIPLQSGSDDILRAMRRRYRTDLYRERITFIKSLMPHACIGVDVITGFPSESEAHFKQTHEFLQALPVSYLHVFTYSERDNTTALRIQDVVPMNDRNRRTNVLRMLSDKKKRAFYEAFSQTNHHVLWEGQEEDGRMFGFTKNYLKVSRPFEAAQVNRIETVGLGKLDNELVYESVFEG